MGAVYTALLVTALLLAVVSLVMAIASNFGKKGRGEDKNGKAKD